MGQSLAELGEISKGFNPFSARKAVAAGTSRRVTDMSRGTPFWMDEAPAPVPRKKYSRPVPPAPTGAERRRNIINNAPVPKAPRRQTDSWGAY